jgi:hypothetical protein
LEEEFCSINLEGLLTKVMAYFKLVLAMKVREDFAFKEVEEEVVG